MKDDHQILHFYTSKMHNTHREKGSLAAENSQPSKKFSTRRCSYIPNFFTQPTEQPYYSEKEGRLVFSPSYLKNHGIEKIDAHTSLQLQQQNIRYLYRTERSNNIRKEDIICNGLTIDPHTPSVDIIDYMKHPQGHCWQKYQFISFSTDPNRALQEYGEISDDDNKLFIIIDLRLIEGYPVFYFVPDLSPVDNEYVLHKGFIQPAAVINFNVSNRQFDGSSIRFCSVLPKDGQDQIKSLINLVEPSYRTDLCQANTLIRQTNSNSYSY